jgi:D-inositol-3-phosphate glycosyltransferase
MIETLEKETTGQSCRLPSKSSEKTATLNPCVALLTGGGDKPYALGLAGALLGQGVTLDFIGSDEVGPQLKATPGANFLNLRGDQNRSVGRLTKMARIGRYYLRLIGYAARTRTKILHILWNNKFEFFDRTFLMLYYRLLGKRLVFTAHNVNAGKRDGNDSWINRFSLHVQYKLTHRIFVHTEQMKAELMNEFGVPAEKVSVIPFGINNTIPDTPLTREEAREALGLSSEAKVMLCFGNIAPYKGLEYAVEALAELRKMDSSYRLIIAGALKGCQDYWDEILKLIASRGLAENVIQDIGYIPDEAVEGFFKAADVLLLPYTHVFQSGVLFLGYSFGLPVIAADVGSLKEEIVEGKTGFVCRPLDSKALAAAVEIYFKSALYRQLGTERSYICEYANDRYSWAKVADITKADYQRLS